MHKRKGEQHLQKGKDQYVFPSILISWLKELQSHIHTSYLDKHIFLTGCSEIPELHNVTKIKQNWATLDMNSPEFRPQQCAIMPCKLLLIEVRSKRKKGVQHKCQESCNPHLELGLTHTPQAIHQKNHHNHGNFQLCWLCKAKNLSHKQSSLKFTPLYSLH